MHAYPLEWVESSPRLVVARCKLKRSGGGATEHVTRRFATLEQVIEQNLSRPRRANPDWVWRVYYNGPGSGPEYYRDLNEAKLHVEARYALESD